MKNSLLLFLALLLLGFSACDDDDAQFRTADCSLDLTTQNCLFINDMTIEEVKQRITGEWKLTTGGGGFFPCEDIAPTDQTKYVFDGDSTIVITLADGTTETGNYFVDTQCGDNPPCWTVVNYSAGLIYAPPFSFFCDNDLAYHDDSPLDGPLNIYRKQN